MTSSEYKTQGFWLTYNCICFELHAIWSVESHKLRSTKPHFFCLLVVHTIHTLHTVDTLTSTYCYMHTIRTYYFFITPQTLTLLLIYPLKKMLLACTLQNVTGCSRVGHPGIFGMLHLANYVLGHTKSFSSLLNSTVVWVWETTASLIHSGTQNGTNKGNYNCLKCLRLHSLAVYLSGWKVTFLHCVSILSLIINSCGGFHENLKRLYNLAGRMQN